jgi:hypothetical protein
MSDAVTSQQPQTWGELGPAMRALPNDKWRAVVWRYVLNPGHGAATRAYRAAGFGRNSTKLNQAKEAYRLIHDERVIAAITEVTRQVLRTAQPEAVKAAQNIIRHPAHPAHGKLVVALLDRTEPIVNRTDMQVVHRHVDADQEALAEYMAAKELGATPEKLRDLFGGNAISRLEQLEAKELERRADKAKVIEGEVVR